MTSAQAAVSPASSSPVSDSASWGRDLVLLTLALSLWFGLFLGSRSLNNPDEGRYTEIPREMAATGDYVTPRLNGVKYFEKPPLVYWLSALTFEVVGPLAGTDGVNEWTARFWGAAFALAGGLMTYAAGRALYRRATGWWAALVVATSILYYGLSRLILLDLVVGVTMAGALFAFIVGIREPAGTRRRWLFMAFYACMALATLTKGLIGFLLPCMVAFVWLLVFNQWRALRPCYPISGALVLLAILAPWHVLAALRNPSVDGLVWPGYAHGLELHHAGKDPGWMWFYFVREHFLRFTTTEHGRFQPAWFFLPILAGGLFPWTVFAGQSVWRSLAGGWRERGRHLEAWFLVIWIVLIVAFFSKSQSKLIPYISPVFPAAAVLIGHYLAQVWAERSGRGVRVGLWVFAGLALALAGAAAFFPLPAKQAALEPQFLPWRFFVGVVMGGGALAVILCLRRGAVRGALIGLVATCVAFFTAANLVEGLFNDRSTKSLAAVLKPRLQPADAVFIVNDYAQDLPVYLGRTVSVVNYAGELTYGIGAEPEKTASRFMDYGAFFMRWRQPAVAYAVVRSAGYKKFFADAVAPFTVIAETPRYVLVVNRQP